VDSLEKTAEIECAKLAKQRVSDLVLNKMVQLTSIGHDKYGRLLAKVYIDGVSIGDLLLKERLAVPYGGATKVCPDNWMKFHTNS
jgi:endonuclease YncB( thermonuclease family)